MHRIDHYPLFGFIGLVTWRVNSEHGTEVVVHSFDTAVIEHVANMSKLE